MAESKSAKSTIPKSGIPAKGSTPPAKAAPKLVESKARSRSTNKKAEASKKPLGTPKSTTNGTPTAPLFNIEPEKLGHMLHDRPAWIDEVAGLIVIVTGIVSLLSVLNTTPSATLASNWAETLRTIFGTVGALIVSMMIMSGGLLILLPKIGIHAKLSWRRVISIEIAFLAFMAVMHLIARDPEPRALARSGGGGGYIGWALSTLIVKLFGVGLSTFLYGAIMLIGIGSAVGVRRGHLRQSIIWVRTHVVALAERLTRESVPQVASAVPVPRQTMAVPAGAQPTTPAAEPVAASPAPSDTSDAPAARPTPMARPLSSSPRQAQPPPEPDSSNEEEQEPLTSATSISSIPTRESLVTRAPQPVLPRAEDVQRHTRHFTVEDFKEVRHTLKRNADLPSMELLSETELNRPTETEINTNVRIIENTLLEFDIDVEIVDVKVGPTVTQYAVQPFREVRNEQGQVVMQRVRVNKIASLSSDLALALSAKTLRIQPYVPGHTYMGIEVPNRTPSVVALRPVMESETFSHAFIKKDADNPNVTVELPLVVPLGRDVSGAAFVADLATMPHLLIAGTTGSGKSVCITAITLALVMNNTPDRLKLVMLDPKMVELTRFNGLPHLLGPVETDMERIIGVLRWATREMDRRYKLLEVEAARNIEAYNRALGKRRKSEHLPYIVILIDEIGDLMLTRPEEMERTLTRLAQMARAVGMHLVVATQRPSVDIITGLIKANFPARISFAVASGIDSRVILDTVGAETLMGRGDMLYQASDAGGPQRVQGCYVSDQELDRVVAYWKQWQADQIASGTLDKSSVAPWDRAMTRRESHAETDPMLEEALAFVMREQQASAAAIQRQLGIDYPRAAQIMDLLQDLGVLGAPKQDGRVREVVVKPGSDRYKKIMEKWRKV